MVLAEKQQTPASLGRLLYEIARIWRSKLDHDLQRLGLSQAKWNVIIELEHSRKKGLLQKDLAELCMVESPTMARLLERMEKEGWVRRQSGLEDRRSKQTYLTEKASAIIAQVREVSLNVEQDIFGELSAQTYQQVRDALLQLRMAIEKPSRSGDKLI